MIHSPIQVTHESERVRSIGINGVPAAGLVLFESIKLGNILLAQLEVKDFGVGVDARGGTALGERDISTIRVLGLAFQPTQSMRTRNAPLLQRPPDENLCRLFVVLMARVTGARIRVGFLSHLFRNLIYGGIGCATDDGAVRLHDDTIFFAVGRDFALLEVRVELCATAWSSESFETKDLAHLNLVDYGQGVPSLFDLF